MKYLNLQRVRLDQIQFPDHIKIKWVSTITAQIYFNEENFIFICFEDEEEAEFFEKINLKSTANQ